MAVLDEREAFAREVLERTSRCDDVIKLRAIIAALLKSDLEFRKDLLRITGENDGGS